MKGYLLDTNVALLAVNTPERLSPAINTTLIEQGPTFLSVISFWEVMIKAMKGKLDVGDPRQWWRETIDALGVTTLLYRPEHIAEVYHLPPIHQDPFDRALIAQAIAEDLTLVTIDDSISRYASDRLRIIQ